MSLSRAEWDRHRDMQQGTLIEDVKVDFLPGGPCEQTIEYEAPFTKPDRVSDYRVAWEYFERELDILTPA